MNIVRKLIQYILLASLLFVQHVYADDQQDIKQLIQNLYSEDVKPLLCLKSGYRSEQDESLIVVSEKYFSLNLIKYYGQNCTGHNVFMGDPRTGEQESYSYEDSQAGFTNLHIEPPKIKGDHARIRTTYDFPDMNYKDWGNFTLFTLIKENGQWKIDDIELGGHDMDKYNKRVSMTGFPVIKSLKKYIKEGLAEHEAKKASEKK